MRAFRDWALRMNRLRDLAGSAASAAAVEEAEKQAKAAEAVYHERRDGLTEEIVHSVR